MTGGDIIVTADDFRAAGCGCDRLVAWFRRFRIDYAAFARHGMSLSDLRARTDNPFQLDLVEKEARARLG